MNKETQNTILAIRTWQKDNRFHPLVCPNHPDHKLVWYINDEEKDEVVLYCDICHYEQKHVPKIVKERWILEGWNNTEIYE